MTSNYISVPGLKADADLSASQFDFVKLNASADFQIDAISAAADDILGVLQNKPEASGQAADVAILGTCKVRAGGSITRGNKIKVTADGEALAATEITDGSAADEEIVGQALESGADQEIIHIVLTGNRGNRAT